MGRRWFLGKSGKELMLLRGELGGVGDLIGLEKKGAMWMYAHF